MTNVALIEAKGDKAAIIVLEDGTRVWTPEKDKADPLVGKPIPSDWTMKEGQYGPQAFPPRPKGGGGGAPAAYRNTKEGHFYEQERMDRRTAAMQATVDGEFHPGVADLIYDWLRRTSGSPPLPGLSQTGDGVSTAPSPPPFRDEGRGKTQDQVPDSGKVQAPPGERDSVAPGACEHEHTSPLKPDGSALPAGKLRCLDCSTVIKG